MEILRAGPEHEPGISSLATRTLGWEADERFRDLYRWKHDRNPFGPSPRWVAVDGGRVVGFRILLRWRFRRGGERVDAVRAVDTATDPSHQGRGIFRALTMTAVDELRERGVGFVFNTPNDQSRPGYLKMGWVDLGRPRIAVVPRPGGLARTARARTGAQLWSEPTTAGRPVEELDLGRLATTARTGAAGRWRTDADEAHLRWRYVDAPLGYRALTGTDAGLDGARSDEVAIFRVRRRGPARECVVAWIAATSASRRRRLVRAAARATRADHTLVAATARADVTPGLALAAFSPLVTGRDLAGSPPPLAELAFALGDLELF